MPTSFQCQVLFFNHFQCQYNDEQIRALKKLFLIVDVHWAEVCNSLPLIGTHTHTNLAYLLGILTKTLCLVSIVILE
jgi:hypothetical protein